ncbi:MAG: hypothetical protein K5829_14065 [Treponema sp.]|nr:hypothetical protein [Treponema sp.]
MKKIINSLLVTFLFSLCAACSLQSGSTKKSVENKKSSYTISGRIETAAALPESVEELIASALDESSDDSRFATSSFSQYAYVKPYFQVSACNETSETNIEGTTYTNSDGELCYSLKVDEEGDWVIKLALFAQKSLQESSDKTTILEGSKTISIPLETSQVDIPLSPCIIMDDEFGHINLELSCEEGLDIDYLEWNWVSVYSEAENAMNYYSEEPSKTFNFDEDGICHVKFANVPSDNYLVNLVFYSSDSDKPLYSVYETISVYVGFITDSWYSSSTSDLSSKYITKNEETDEYDFIITKDCLSTYSNVVSGYTIDNTPYLLWDDKAFNIFDSITESQSLGDFYVDFDSLNINFAAITEEEKDSFFIYYLNDSLLYRLKESYAGFTFDDEFGSKNLLELIEKTDEYSAVSSPTVLSNYVYENKVYFFWSLYANQTSTYYFSIYNLDDDSMIITEDISDKDIKPCKFLVVSASDDSAELCVTDNSSISYAIYNNENGYGEYDLCDITASRFDLYASSFSVGDLLFKDDYLYVLLYSYGHSELYYLTGSYYSQIYTVEQCVSSGGVLKLKKDEVNCNFSPEAWDNGEYILGLYTKCIDNSDSYYYYQNSDEEYKYLENDYKIVATPPLDSEDFYFYGPRKFIARKNDELIIADDGGYVKSYDEAEEKNRVVTINLLNNSISSTDVDVSFSSHFYESESAFVKGLN